MLLEFRGRLAPHILVAVKTALGTFVVGLLLNLSLLPPHMRVPLVLASVASGLAVLGWRYFALYRREGVVVDDECIRDIAGKITIRWDDVRVLRFAVMTHALHDSLALLRYAVVEAEGGAALAFCDKGPLSTRTVQTPHGPLINVSESGLLIALIAERLQVDSLLPTSGAVDTQALAADAGEGASAPCPRPCTEPQGDTSQTVTGASGTQNPPGHLTVRRAYGLLPLLGKIAPNIASVVGKLGKAAATGLKTFKLGTAAVSFGAYGLLFNWKSAAALLLMIAWHEYGHVHAMRRCGVAVRGIYFVPFLGGAAVHEAPIAHRAHQAYVALSGPLWGLALTGLAALFFVATGRDSAWLAVVVAVWAAVNLFNLLPILPLDGGRTLAALAFSLDSRVGLGVALACLGAGLVFSVATGLGLLALLIAVGAIEFAAENQAARRRTLLGTLASARSLTFDVWFRLQSLARIVTSGQATEQGRAEERAAFARLQTLLEGKPMTRQEMLLAGAGYGLMLLTYSGLLLLVGSMPGADLVRQLFR